MKHLSASQIEDLARRYERYVRTRRPVRVQRQHATFEQFCMNPELLEGWMDEYLQLFNPDKPMLCACVLVYVFLN